MRPARLLFLILACLALGAPVSAGQADDPSAISPVSLDRIREALNRRNDLVLQAADLPVDFRLAILEQQNIDALLAKMDFSSGPAPGGGLYGYEQQRRLFNPVDRPLMQPYAGYNGGQFATVAVENLVGQYVAKPLIDGLIGVKRSMSERGARDEVRAAIADYCAAQPNRDDISLCTTPPLDR